MNKTLYVKEEALKNTDTNIPIGIILNISNEEYHLEDIMNLIEKDMHNIKSLIIDINYQNGMKIIQKENVFYRFLNEDDYREDISKLTKEEKSHIIGARLCSSGVHILSYKIIGITNIQITTPLSNDIEFLKNLKNAGCNLFCIANLNSTPKGILDPSWIRPEGLYQFNGIMENFILETSETTNTDFIISSYHNEESIGLIRDFVVGFENYDKRFVNCPNLLNMTFDISRLNCKADCLYCSQCERNISLSQSFSGQE